MSKYEMKVHSTRYRKKVSKCAGPFLTHETDTILKGMTAYSVGKAVEK